MRHTPKAYERYRHFKGNCYQVLAIAKSSEDESEQVVYQALYPPFTIYVRPLSGFMSEVDSVKYPSAGQRYRFELIEESSGGRAIEESFDSGAIEESSGGRAIEESFDSGAIEESSDGGAIEETSDGGAIEESSDSVSIGENRLQEAVEPDGSADADGMIDEDVLAFLDADTYEQKMNIFSALHSKVTQEMLNTIAVSLDIEVDSGDLEERYRQIQSCLQTFQRYECNRLR